MALLKWFGKKKDASAKTPKGAHTALDPVSAPAAIRSSPTILPPSTPAESLPSSATPQLAEDAPAVKSPEPAVPAPITSAPPAEEPEDVLRVTKINGSSGNAGGNRRVSGRAREMPSLVTVLLDGDSDYFKRQYLNLVGGRKVAIALHDEVEKHIRAKEGAGSARPVIQIMLFMNMTGLGEFLNKGQGIRVDLAAFSQGFNSSPFACCAIDTGGANQSADEALKNHLAVHINTSDYLMLGGTHDGGYSTALHQLGLDIARSKITLLRTTPFFARPLADLNLNCCSFPELFDGREPTFNRKGAFVAKTSPACLPSPGKSTPLPSSAKPLVAPITPAYTPSSPKPAPTIGITRVLAPLPRLLPAAVKNPEVADFKPLIELLTAQQRAGIRQPLRSSIGQSLRASHPSLYENFKDYAAAAEALSIVILGSGLNGFAEWIELSEDSNTHLGVAIPVEFLPLMTVLRRLKSEGMSQPKRAIAGAELSKAYPRIYEESGESLSSFKSYTTQAKSLGLIELGGADGCAWIALTAQAPSSAAVQHAAGIASKAALEAGLALSPVDDDGDCSQPSTPIPSPTLSAPLIPRLAPTSPTSVKFQPLRDILQANRSATPPNLRPTRTKISGALRMSHPLLYDSWKDYAGEAEKLGIVRLGAPATGSGYEWIELLSEVSQSERLAPEYAPLVLALRRLAAAGTKKPLWSAVGLELKKTGQEVGPFKLYVALAAKQGVVTTGGAGPGTEWMKLTKAYAA